MSTASTWPKAALPPGIAIEWVPDDSTKQMLGRKLNRADATFPCPRCGVQSWMDVYLLAVRWSCGHTRPLPPIGYLRRSTA
ncbi:hypothetical protein [Amycolatopsis sp. YIM 10]|uniref:hypothetical protein n=1 Tax=Amycolatopsis sp. YIM 10 TaxID=2653857 RepID=UPI0012902A01|nr:hypothetical protein [Amycolatopsis sp. YIM 10]QFU87840.1 hypothetical protein YIM_13270 [Amycolatopsis sp. YIM 10]QFU94847.1 hypothetical protein YIM_48610 [Amycolatopsis sp. YIM 10]